MKIYSENYYTCPYCFKRYKALKVGSVFIFPRHSTRNRNAQNIKTKCKGSSRMINFDDINFDDINFDEINI